MIKDRIRVGFWREHESLSEVSRTILDGFTKLMGEKVRDAWTGFPSVRDSVRPNWIHAKRIAKYLELHTHHQQYVFEAFYGDAMCVLCGKSIGNKEFSDGAFVWPEGLLHYIRVHDVMVPDDRFVAHVLKRKG